MVATTIEQSKHLLELGLDPSTSDMYYPYLGAGMYGDTPRAGFPIEHSGGRDIPAWSLSALLEVMPMNINDYDLYITKHKYVDGGYAYNIEYNRGFTISVLHKETNRNVITAAYEMVCWLLENNLIKKGGQDERD